MPQIIAPVIIEAALAAGVSFGTAIVISNVVIGVAVIGANFALSRALTKKPKLPSFANEAQGRSVTIRSSIESHKIIYGKVRTGGTLVFISASDSGLVKKTDDSFFTLTKDNQFLHMVIAVAGHKVNDIESVFLGDEELTLDTDGFATNSRYIVDGQYVVKVHRHLGDDDQLVDLDLANEVDIWTADHRLRGIAYLYVRLQYSPKAFPNGIPEVRCIIQGKQVYDPRISSAVYSNNWALCVRDYLLDTSYGLGASASEVNETSVIAAANICDEQVALTTGTQERYDCNGVIDTGISPLDNIITGLCS